LRAAALFVALAFAAKASAQEVDAEKFKAFLASPVNNNLVNQAVATLPPEIFARCATLRAPGGKTSVVKPITFSADGIPLSGEWMSRLPVAGCGNDTVINLLFSASSADGKIRTLVLAPGTTIASPPLQQDALSRANAGFESRARDCPTSILTNTRFEGFGIKDPPVPDPGPNAGRMRPWWETWTVKGCGKTIDVPLNFVPEATGATVSASLKNVLER
jgi:hypothetical protein